MAEVASAACFASSRRSLVKAIKSAPANATDLVDPYSWHMRNVPSGFDFISSSIDSQFGRSGCMLHCKSRSRPFVSPTQHGAPIAPGGLSFRSDQTANDQQAKLQRPWQNVVAHDCVGSARVMQLF